jgi:antitoxin (DNA-binding transcriptional repressor) of toxin-antitoxin stability system
LEAILTREALAELRRVCNLHSMSRPVRRDSRTPSAPKGPKPRPRVVTATAAVRRFADLVEDVRRTGRAWTVTHHGRAVCAIGPAQPGSATLAALVDALRAGPQPDAGLAVEVRRAARSQARVEPPRWVG